MEIEFEDREKKINSLYEKSKKRLKAFLSAKRESKWKYKIKDERTLIYIPGEKGMFFEFVDNEPFQGNFRIFLEWLYNKSIDFDTYIFNEEEKEIRALVASNTLKLTKYNNHPLSRNNDLRYLIDLLLTKTGKYSLGNSDEFNYAKQLVEKYGIEDVKKVTNYCLVDDYWGKSFNSFKYFLKQFNNESKTYFERILENAG